MACSSTCFVLVSLGCLKGNVDHPTIVALGSILCIHLFCGEVQLTGLLSLLPLRVTITANLDQEGLQCLSSLLISFWYKGRWVQQDGLFLPHNSWPPFPWPSVLSLIYHFIWTKYQPDYPPYQHKHSPSSSPSPSFASPSTYLHNLFWWQQFKYLSDTFPPKYQSSSPR